MSRAVSEDHVMFNESIAIFQKPSDSYQTQSSQSYIALPFELKNDWDLGAFKLSKTTRVNIVGAKASFVTTVSNPSWIGMHDAHLFGIAIATILSFITGKPCKSTRDTVYNQAAGVYEAAIQNPILVAGPGAHISDISNKKEKEIMDELNLLANSLIDNVDKKYKSMMQAMRLVYLSIVNLRDDFGLSYLLIVSAIESIAQRAISRDKVKKKEPKEKEWEKIAATHEDVRVLLENYKEARGKNEYLKERYIKFIFDYAPPSLWKEIVAHPMQEHVDSMENRIEGVENFNLRHLTEKSFHEEYPEDLSEEQLVEIIGRTYNYRSGFVHKGEQPPYQHPISISERFFTEQSLYSFRNDREYYETVIMPNYTLLSGIAKHAIMKWYYQKK